MFHTLQSLMFILSKQRLKSKAHLRISVAQIMCKHHYRANATKKSFLFTQDDPSCYFFLPHQCKTQNESEQIRRIKTYKVKPPIPNTHHKINTMYHMHTLGASKCMHVVHSVGFAMGVGDGWFYLNEWG